MPKPINPELHYLGINSEGVFCCKGKFISNVESITKIKEISKAKYERILAKREQDAILK